MTAPIPGERRLATLLEEQARRIGKLEAGQRATQLGYSSIHNAYIKAFDAQSQVRMLLGRQNDGTFGVTYANGPKPAKPTGTIVGARQLSVLIGWDGTFEGGVLKPGDFARVDVHISEDGPAFVPDGLTVVGQLLSEGSLTVTADNVTHYVKLVVVTTSDVASDPTDAVAVLPLPAGQIAAGVVGAEQLAAEIVLASKVILGDPSASRLEIDETGIAQYTDTGSETLRLGSGSASSNFLTIVSPTNPDDALATISADGIITAQGFSVEGDLEMGGENVATIIDRRARGLAAWGQHYSNRSTTTETGLMELEVVVEPGRMYEVHTSVVYSWQAATAAGELRLRYTTNGTRPTVSSPVLAISARAAGEGGPMNIHAIFRGTDVASGRMRLLWTLASIGGPLVEARNSGDNGFAIWCNDIGPAITPTGVVVDGGGGAGTPPPQTRRTTTWHCAWSGCWDPNNLRNGSTGEMIQGTYGGTTFRSAFGFDVNAIRAELAGATIHDVGVYLYAKHWYYNSGGYARIGQHSGTPNGVYPGTSARFWVVKMGKPQGLWISLGSAFGYAMRDNGINGLTLDATDVAPNLADYGKFDGQSQAGHPIISFDYTK